MADIPVDIRRLVAADLPAYKQLRDEMLLAHPEAFTSDADEERRKEPADYLYRLGLDRHEGGHFLLGAWRGDRLVGAVGCERDVRRKGRHIGHVVGMMVRPALRGHGVGGALIDALVGEVRRGDGVAMLTLTVTVGNASAIRLYEARGFVPYGTLVGAIRLPGGRQFDKLHMVLAL
jgi:ribosomal protein S18 acetylase RimI-like enzyme